MNIVNKHLMNSAGPYTHELKSPITAGLVITIAMQYYCWFYQVCFNVTRLLSVESLEESTRQKGQTKNFLLIIKSGVHSIENDDDIGLKEQ